jgi:hypothetical protein
MNLRTILATIFTMLCLVLEAPAQDAGPDPEIRSTDAMRTCREVHRATQVNEASARVTPQGGIVFDCQLVNANGSTIAQVSPEEICERMIGTREWRRGEGKQVFCLASGVKTRVVDVPCPQPLDEMMKPEDVTHACQKLNRTANVGAEKIVVTVNGPQLACRVNNANGFTISGITPEYVCEAKTGRRYWCNTETTVYCRGSDYVGPSPGPNPNPVILSKPVSPAPPGPGPGGGGSELPESELQPKEIALCKPDPVTGEYVLKVTKFVPNAPGYSITFEPELASCGGEPEPVASACERLTGDKGFYLSTNGFNKKGNFLQPNFIVVCNVPGPRRRLGFANFNKMCAAKGWPLANTGVTRGISPYCGDSKKVGIEEISTAETCKMIFGTTAFTRVDVLYWCLP